MGGVGVIIIQVCKCMVVIIVTLVCEGGRCNSNTGV